MSALLFVIELTLPKSPRRQIQTWRGYRRMEFAPLTSRLNLCVLLRKN
jgi:hypothetical protein